MLLAATDYKRLACVLPGAGSVTAPTFAYCVTVFRPETAEDNLAFEIQNVDVADVHLSKMFVLFIFLI